MADRTVIYLKKEANRKKEINNYKIKQIIKKLDSLIVEQNDNLKSDKTNYKFK